MIEDTLRFTRARIKRLRGLLLPILLLTVPLMMPGCAGGGTSGTGGGNSFQLTGVLRQTGGPVIAGATVRASTVAPARLLHLVGNSTVSRSTVSDATVTDQNGGFTVFVDRSAAQDVALAVTGAGFSASYRVTNIPATAAIAQIDLEYDDESDELQNGGVEYEDENGEPVDH